jgi:hypothetical protein
MSDPADFDFLAFCRPGLTLKTRDRRDTRILDVDRRNGLIAGTVPMLGPCTWRADGRYKDAPAGAAGPWDLMPPLAAERAAPERDRESLADALQRGDGNPGCCD